MPKFTLQPNCMPKAQIHAITQKYLIRKFMLELQKYTFVLAEFFIGNIMLIQF